MKERGFTPIAIFLIVFSIGTLGYFIYRPNQKVFTSSHTLNVSEETSPSPSSDDEVEFIDSIYSNEKYNFKLKYLSKCIFQGKETCMGWIEEKGNNIVYKEKDLDSNRITNDDTYVIYDVNASDKDDMSGWWKANIKTDIDGGIVPTDYTVYTNLTDLIWHPDRPLQHWDTAPPGIYVGLNENAASKMVAKEGYYMPIYSVYLYYDFGKPFVVSFIAGNTGAGSNPGVFSYIERLH